MSNSNSSSPNIDNTLVSGSLLVMKPMKGCEVCGSKLVFIRGKYPGDKKRKICPCCAQERLEDLIEISQPGYGITVKNNDR